jgi:hypothetical protein
MDKVYNCNSGNDRHRCYTCVGQESKTDRGEDHASSCLVVTLRDENGTEIFRIDRFRFLYHEPFFNMKNCQFQLVS